MATTPTSYNEGNYTIRPIGGGRYRVEYNKSFKNTIQFGISGSMFIISQKDIKNGNEPTIMKRLISDDTGNRASYNFAIPVEVTFGLPRVVEEYTSAVAATSPDGVKYTKYIDYKKHTLVASHVDAWRYKMAFVGGSGVGTFGAPNTIETIAFSSLNGIAFYDSEDANIIITLDDSGSFTQIGFGSKVNQGQTNFLANRINEAVTNFILENRLKDFNNNPAKPVEFYLQKNFSTLNSITIRLNNGRVIQSEVRTEPYGMAIVGFSLLSDTRVIRLENGSPISIAKQMGVGDNGLIAYGSASKTVNDASNNGSYQALTMMYGGEAYYVGSTGSGGRNKRNKMTVVSSGWDCNRKDSFITALNQKVNGVAWADSTSINFKAPRVVSPVKDITAVGGKLPTGLTGFCQMFDDGGNQYPIKTLAATPLVPISETQRWAVKEADLQNFNDKIVITDSVVIPLKGRGIPLTSGWGLVFEQYSLTGKPNAIPYLPVHNEATISVGTPSSCVCARPEMGCITYDYN